MKTLVTTVCFLLAGCAANPDRYRQTSTLELCRQLMTFPSYNVWHPSRTAELDRRGENCGGAAAIAAGQQSADQRALETLRTIDPPKPRPIQCTTDRFGNTTCW
jgi:hypothetical protein